MLMNGKSCLVPLLVYDETDLKLFSPRVNKLLLQLHVVFICDTRVLALQLLPSRKKDVHANRA